VRMVERPVGGGREDEEEEEELWECNFNIQ
jgi:hypothetical protein